MWVASDIIQASHAALSSSIDADMTLQSDIGTAAITKASGTSGAKGATNGRSNVVRSINRSPRSTSSHAGAASQTTGLVLLAGAAVAAIFGLTAVCQWQKLDEWYVHCFGDAYSRVNASRIDFLNRDRELADDSLSALLFYCGSQSKKNRASCSWGCSSLSLERTLISVARQLLKRAIFAGTRHFLLKIASVFITFPRL